MSRISLEAKNIKNLEHGTIIGENSASKGTEVTLAATTGDIENYGLIQAATMSPKADAETALVLTAERDVLGSAGSLLTGTVAADGTHSGGGTVTVTAVRDIDLGDMTAGGKVLVRSTGGTWNVYSATPVGAEFGGLSTSDLAKWQTAYGTGGQTYERNQFIFQDSPVIEGVIDTVHKEYGKAWSKENNENHVGYRYADDALSRDLQDGTWSTVFTDTAPLEDHLLSELQVTSRGYERTASRTEGSFRITYNGVVLNVTPEDAAAVDILQRDDADRNVTVAAEALHTAFSDMGLVLEDLDGVYIHMDR